ncbi:hypothetical protein [Planomonospora venezuelensis]|uniref:Uncharacterized protein n=1 Tax=Planomonospora venezuelensis TaxID=1999 RepID=A0A841DEL1_PLAVE|nr:hypothetical protein [Planomonospora venezuelensis]MBB5967203.1 hypothetical protein [Planomonospora venezuelensis]GIN02972.1 hypothetical protein Pve01_46300 [Planomonospora venezuelensis]
MTVQAPGPSHSTADSESWRHLQTAAALGAWAVLGLAVAPVVLRRESGTASRRANGAGAVPERYSGVSPLT